MKNTILILGCMLIAFLQAQQIEKGIIVTKVGEGSEAEKVGLKEQDIIVFITNYPIKTVDTLFSIKQFIQQLENYWKKSGKKRDFWRANAEVIQKATGGILVEPR